MDKARVIKVCSVCYEPADGPCRGRLTRKTMPVKHFNGEDTEYLTQWQIDEQMEKMEKMEQMPKKR